MNLSETSWVSVLPPLLAIGLAIAFRQVIVALLLGIFLGALFLHEYNPLTALVSIVDNYALNALADRDHSAVVIFTMMLGGMVGVVGRSGGAKGLAQKITSRATTTRRVQISTWLMGLFVFFDDYANTLLVGPTMRPISDKLKVSREKLAFIVDATAAPVASVAVFSSWIGVEIGLIADQYETLGLATDPYIVFLQSLPYRFYPWLMLFFGLMVALGRKDFGPMLKAERRAFLEGKPISDSARPIAGFENGSLVPREGKPNRWFNAAIPIFVVIMVIVLSMWIDGLSKINTQLSEVSLKNIFANADSYKALLWASLSGCLTAILLPICQRIITISQAIDAWLGGLKSMVLAMVILILSWSLGDICEQLHTAKFIIGAIGDWLSPALLPALVFCISGLVSFATGTSWGTMAILFPLAIPLAFSMAAHDQTVIVGTVSSILAGSVWGDHCSPLSDTTIMSSMACSCDHIDHVRTQIPYALVVGLVSLILGDLGCGLGLWNAWVGLILGMFVLLGILFFWGKRPDSKE